MGGRADRDLAARADASGGDGDDGAAVLAPRDRAVGRAATLASDELQTSSSVQSTGSSDGSRRTELQTLTVTLFGRGDGRRGTVDRGEARADGRGGGLGIGALDAVDRDLLGIAERVGRGLRDALRRRVSDVSDVQFANAVLPIFVTA